MIYLDSGATTIVKPKVVEKEMVYALNNYGNPQRGTYPSSVNALKAIYKAREKIAGLFNVSDNSLVAFTSNITEALNICADLIINEGDNVITTIFEHNSILRPLYKKKANVKVIDLADNGGSSSVILLNYDKMRVELEKGAKAVFCTHASNLTGDMVDIQRVGALCKQYGAFFVLDTAQTAGIFDIDMQSIEADFLCFTGHKSLYGPQGVGGICVKKGLAIKPVKVGGSGFDTFNKEHPQTMPQALEAGTLNTPAICGLSAGIDFINEITIKSVKEHEQMLMKRLYNSITTLPNIKIYGNFNKEKAPIVTFNIGKIDSGIVAEELWKRGEIAVRSGIHCSPLFHKYLKTDKQGAVRVSFSYFNTVEEIDKTALVIKNICKET